MEAEGGFWSSCVVRERALGDFWFAGGEWDVFLVCFRLPRVVFFLALRFQLSSRFFLFGLDKIVLYPVDRKPLHGV